MRKILSYINFILDHAIRYQRGKLLLAPVIIAGIISGAVTIGSKIAADRKAKKLAKGVDVQAAEERRKNEIASQKAVEVARSTARAGDPTLAAKQRQIKETGANVVGKAVATSKSTQEIINAAQGTQANIDRANISAQSQAGQVKLNLRQQLAGRFAEAGRTRLAGEGLIDRRLQNAIDAIGSNAQATVDTAQNLGKQGVDIAAFLQSQKLQKELAIG